MLDFESEIRNFIVAAVCLRKREDAFRHFIFHISLKIIRNSTRNTEINEQKLNLLLLKLLSFHAND